ncbi:MAG TPA: sulfite exporter TauE/SafE family protein [Ramlibacter sp.]|nr:sulfite exporter TauE/SafE family protein [Ramlibacter sp.]
MFPYDFAFVLAGFLVGLVVGLTGVGGGSLMTPILIFGFGIKPYLAIGTDLLFAAATKFGGSIGLARARAIDWPVVGLLSAGSIPAALATIFVLHRLGPANPSVQAVMTTTLGGALLLTAAATLYKAIRGKSLPRHLEAAELEQARKPRHWWQPVLFGAAIGALVSLTSVGAGAIGVTVLMLLYPALPLPRIIAADIAYAVPLTLVAGLGHASIGSVDWPLLGTLLVGSLPGIWIGSRLVRVAPDRLIRSLLSLLLAYAGIRLVSL